MKILFTDLDETLLTSDKQISESDLASIRKMIDAGHRFVVASGRPFYSTYNLCKEYGFTIPGFYVVASNGGVIFDCTTGKIIHRETVPYEYVSYVFDKARRAGLHIHTYTDDYVVSERETEELKRYSSKIKMPYKILPSIPDALPYEPPKMIVVSYESRSILEKFREELYDWEHGKLSSVFSSPHLLEYLPIESKKGNALIRLCEHLDIPLANSVACGDEENDISMIEAAGVGVAMKNGTDLVKAHADYITAHTNNENGITEVIERFIL